MKVGIITIYNVPNFGSVLQAYATQKVLEALGHDAEIIQYVYPNKLQKKTLKNIKSLIYFLTAKYGIVSQQRKSLKLKQFRHSKFNFTKPFLSYSELKLYNWDHYDALIVGSDQVWNTRFTNGEPAFLLSFAPDNKKRFSIASSFSSDKVDAKFELLFRNELIKFSAISVREKEGRTIIRNQLGINKDVFICLDPTLLINRQDWLCHFPSSRKQTKPYILYYMWAYAFDPRPFINNVVSYFVKKTKIDIVIALEGAPKHYIDGIHYINKEDSTIPEFLELFANASLVITSSFHGTAFAINMGIPLVSVVPNNGKDSRQSNLLNMVGASNCIVNASMDLESIDPNYNIIEVQNKLADARKNCINWIETNIK